MPNRNDQTDNIEALVTQVLFFNAVMPKFAEQGQAWASQAETDIINTGNKVQQTTIGNLQLVMMVQSGTIVIIVKKP